MKQEADMLKDWERVSACFDSESGGPDADEAWIVEHPEMAGRRRDYAELSRLLQGLSAPETDDVLVQKILFRAYAHRRFRRGATTGALALAACVVLVLGAWLYAPQPDLFSQPAPDAVASLSGVAMPWEEAVDEELLPPVLDELHEGLYYVSTLEQFEHVHPDILIALLVEINIGEEDDVEFGDDGIVSPWEAPDIFSVLFEFVDSLNSVEAAALNASLRAALAEA